MPRILLAHAQVLVGLAAASVDPAPIIDVVLELFSRDQHSGFFLKAFSWSALSQSVRFDREPVAEPLFVNVGRLLSRKGGDVVRLQRLLADEPEAHVLAYVLLGVGEESTLRALIEPPLKRALNSLLADVEGISLGHALELANTLQQATMGRDAERFARRVLQISSRLQHGHGIPYRDSAHAIMAGALAQQEMWPELLAMGVEIDEPRQRLFVDNMRALALMETERPDEARALLDVVLERDPNNRVALINRTALYVRIEAWDEVLTAVDEARKRLPAEDLDGVAINEAVACDKLGDEFRASRILASLTPEHASRADILAMRERLQARRPAPEHELQTELSMAMVQAAGCDALDERAVPAPTIAAEPVDIAIVTALREEYDAVLSRLTDPTPVPPEETQFPNLYSWVLGRIPRESGIGYYRVVLAVAGRSGNLRSGPTTLRTIDQWNPTFVIFSGIAGGLARNGLKQGDLVLSESVWHYEYGKIVNGRYEPRQRASFRAHSGLLSSALSFEGGMKTWRQCGLDAPTTPHEPACIAGVIGSGEKVIDDLEPAIVRAILSARPELQAFEMEAGGAAAAVEQAHEEGKAVGFLMVRGISDMPKSPQSFTGRVFALFSRNARPSKGAGTNERDAWKLYASSIAASFTCRWIASRYFPAVARL